MSVEASKNNLARELFVRTADENARCANNRLNTDFLWLAVHALEKYLKAVLLVNGHDTRGLSQRPPRALPHAKRASDARSAARYFAIPTFAAFSKRARNLARNTADCSTNPALSVLPGSARIEHPDGGIQISLIIQRFQGSFGKNS